MLHDVHPPQPKTPTPTAATAPSAHTCTFLMCCRLHSGSKTLLLKRRTVRFSMSSLPAGCIGHALWSHWSRVSGNLVALVWFRGALAMVAWDADVVCMLVEMRLVPMTRKEHPAMRAPNARRPPPQRAPDAHPSSGRCGRSGPRSGAAPGPRPARAMSRCRGQTASPRSRASSRSCVVAFGFGLD